MSLAKVILSGTVTSEPEKRFTPNTNAAVTTFTLLAQSLSRSNANGMGLSGQDGTFTVKITCWRQLADTIAEQIHKDDVVLVDGKLLILNHQQPDGVVKKGFEIEAQHIDKLASLPQSILGGGQANEGSARPQAQAAAPRQPVAQAAQPAYSAAAPSNAAAQPFSSDDLLTEDDIPF